MRIGIDLHTMTHLMQGSRTYIYNLVQALLEIDKANEYFLYFPNSAALRNSPWAKQANAHPQVILPATRYIRLPVAFPLKLAAHRIDVFHCQYMAPPVCPCPYVVSLHDIIHETHPQFYPAGLRLLMHRLYPLSARRAAKVLTISQYSKTQIAEIYQIPEDRIVVTSVGVSGAFRPIEKTEKVGQVAEKYGIRGRYLLFVGRIEPRKNLATLIDAYRLLQSASNTRYQLVLVGMQDPLFEDFFHGMRARAGGGSVVFTGGIAEEDLPYLYNGADLFVYPSFAEGFGLPVLEAMACGVPVITSNVSSLPEAAGDAGIMVAPTDTEGLATAMHAVLSDPARREEMRLKGIERAKKFSWRHTAEKVLQVYLEQA